VCVQMPVNFLTQCYQTWKYMNQSKCVVTELINLKALSLIELPSSEFYSILGNLIHICFNITATVAFPIET
jgi:hypothetical protein